MTSYSAVQSRRSSLLRRTLQANMLFSALSGTLFIADARPIGQLVGIDIPWLYAVIGVGLLGYAVMLYSAARAEPINPQAAMAFVVMDALWVVGSVVLIEVAWPQLTTAGVWAIAIVADIVAVFAVAQFVGARQLQADQK